jgi:hypothetical protein
VIVCFVESVELLTTTIKTFFCFVVISGIVDHPKQKKVLTVMVNNSTDHNKTKESFNSGGQQFHRSQQNKRKF